METIDKQDFAANPTEDSAEQSNLTLPEGTSEDTGENVGEKSDNFSQFGLREPLVRAVHELGYETPTPIQIQTIPHLLAGKDIVGQAQTGTGKTAAFALPVLHNIDVSQNKVQVLVLCPTRELALQVAEAFHSYSKHLGRLRVLPVYGGQSIFQQIQKLRGGVQVIVGTPGRVMDHLRRETLDLSNLKTVILDEADEMLRMGFIDDVEWILSHVPAEHQTALFSATMPREVRRIADRHLKNAVNIEAERKTLTVPTVKQFYVNVGEGQKLDVLTRLLETESVEGEAVLIFDRTKIGADQVTEKLQARGYAAEAMHGDMSQAARESVIRRLKNGQVEVVVATDVAARGLDVDRISRVINYDMPSDVEVYVHRIGRTGRAGREGTAILFITPRQQRMKRDIENYTKQKIEPMKLPTKADVAARRVQLFKDRILKTIKDDELDLYLTFVQELMEESGADAVEIAAAAARLASGDKPLEEVKPIEPEPEQLPPAEDGMTRLFLDVGTFSRVTPGDIVGAIANEAGIAGRSIGAIDIYDRFTLVDVPTEYVKQILKRMTGTRIRNHHANIRPAAPRDTAPQTPREEAPSRPSAAPPQAPAPDFPNENRRPPSDKSGKPKSKFAAKPKTKAAPKPKAKTDAGNKPPRAKKIKS